MKLAAIDLLLQYPPTGGAAVDLLNTLGVLKGDFDMKIFCPRWHGSPSGRGRISGDTGIPIEIVEVASPSRDAVTDALKDAVAAWRPDAVLVSDGWTLKPYIIDSLKSLYPLVVRMYAYECVCPRNNERWLPHGRCESNALLDCDGCLKCAKEYCNIVHGRRGGADNPLTEEMRIAGIFSGDYGATLNSAFNGTHAIAYNSSMAELLRVHGGAKTFVSPGGVSASFRSMAKPSRNDGLFRVLVAGRMDDPAKGAATAMEAGRMIASSGKSFRMLITRTKSDNPEPWLEELGWIGQDELRNLMASCDCAIVPSLWDEAFGMVWAEAMASGLPVIASSAPGPMEFIEHGVNGLLFERGDAPGLARMIEYLHGSPDLRKRLSEAGAAYAKESLAWGRAAGVLRDALMAAVSTFAPAKPPENP